MTVNRRPDALLPAGRVWNRRKDSGARTAALAASLVLHVMLLFFAGGWLDSNRLRTEAPFVVSLVVPGPEVVARDLPAAEESTPNRVTEASRAAEQAPVPEQGEGILEAPVLDDVVEALLPPVVMEPAQGESSAGDQGMIGRERRDVVGELTARLLAQMDSFSPLPTAIASPSPAPPGESNGRRIGATAGIEGDLGERGLIHLEDPSYPARARARGIEAEVLFRFWVSPAGYVVGIQSLRKSGQPEFESLARESLSRWRFEPLPPGHEQNEYGDVRIRWGFPVVVAGSRGGRQ